MRYVVFFGFGGASLLFGVWALHKTAEIPRDDNHVHVLGRAFVGGNGLGFVIAGIMVIVWGLIDAIVRLL